MGVFDELKKLDTTSVKLRLAFVNFSSLCGIWELFLRLAQSVKFNITSRFEERKGDGIAKRIEFNYQINRIIYKALKYN